jgi:hypothetical protein
VRSQEALPTSFKVCHGQPIQVNETEKELPLPVIDLSGLGRWEREHEAKRLARRDGREPFDLSRGPLIRAMLMKLGAQEHAVLLTMHHIVSDDWSMGVLVEDVVQLYEAYRRGEPSPLDELDIQYVDYAVWQKQWLRGDAYEEHLRYWRESLGGELPVLRLMRESAGPAVQSYEGASETVALGLELSERLKELSRAEGVTLFMTLLAGFKALLHLYSGQDEIIVGTVIANRTQKEVERLIGFFVNMLAMKTDLSGDPSFAELLRRVREMALGAYTHQDLSFEKLVEELQPQRDLSYSPIFQVVFVLQNATKGSLELTDLKIEYLDIGIGSVLYDWVLEMEDTDNGLAGSLKYKKHFFSQAMIKQAVEHFKRILEIVASNPQIKLLDIGLNGAKESAGFEVPAEVWSEDDANRFDFALGT